MASTHKWFLKIASRLFFFLLLKSGKNPNDSVLISNLPVNVHRTNTPDTDCHIFTFQSPLPAPLLPSFQNNIRTKKTPALTLGT